MSVRATAALIFLTATIAGSLAWPQTAPATSTKKTAGKKTTAKKSTKSAKTVAKSSKSSKSAKSSKSGKSARSARSPHHTAAARQMAPTPERYKEIQQALVDKGYLKSEPSGVWDADSIDAMTRFQNDQKLPATGKLTAASLIKLGLGPSTAGSAPGVTGAESAAESGTPPPASPSTEPPHAGPAPDAAHSSAEN